MWAPPHEGLHGQRLLQDVHAYGMHFACRQGVQHDIKDGQGINQGVHLAQFDWRLSCCAC
jgi:hypothetical protein